MKQFTLSEIWIYPIKSLGGIQLTSAKVQEKGLQYDRRWMLVDENNTFMTQRIHPPMALFKVSIINGEMTIIKQRPLTGTKPSISFNTNTQSSGKTMPAVIWNDQVDVVEVSTEVNNWFSSHLGFKCKLVSFPEQNSRPVDPKYEVNQENVSLADAYPFLIIGQGSLDDLNCRLARSLPMNRFRPNFVFTGGEPYEEDQWRDLSIGKNRFVAVKQCARCVLPNVNQDTAEKGVEPLATLSTYRKRDSKVLFGQNLVALDHFEVSVGDKITLN